MYLQSQHNLQELYGANAPPPDLNAVEEIYIGGGGPILLN
jgi:hypothetical protein